MLMNKVTHSGNDEARSGARVRFPKERSGFPMQRDGGVCLARRGLGDQEFSMERSGLTDCLHCKYVFMFFHLDRDHGLCQNKFKGGQCHGGTYDRLGRIIYLPCDH
uniref:Uncharacterized protein n=1 Tax=Anolis carolinensis TaxID=28377 RepID=A0A803TG42_ANOCA